VGPFPRLVRWAIAFITAFFVVMMFTPLVQEIVRRAGVSGTVNLP
jgi:UDP-N-acetylmuramyl pentapeptide phosphotransferase/UDP-N-acetylglucosamine-1-phosphate transferase